MSNAAPILPWLWIPIVLAAALAQTARNAAQRSLVAQAGTLGATLARFLYGLPFAALWVVALHGLPATAATVPSFHAGYFAWLMLGAAGQLAATACLLAAMKQRNFVIGVAYSKTDALQVALFATLFLRELPGWITVLAMLLATAGVVLLSVPPKAAADGVRAWTGRAGWYGLASGAGFALSAVGYRGAALQLSDTSVWLNGAWGVLWAQAAQSVVLGAWLAWRAPQSLRALATAWRVSILAGGMGALASIGWFTAFALTTAANVRTLGMVEVVFSYLVSHRLLREKLSRADKVGLALVGTGLLALCLKL
ncbi:EamA/RhaT family transporter [Ramlibacter sp. WS9]|uniref:EamA/RhaT family transporter n=1 Tax=Ramlibacter sp. WS9 TaxID=1882741 RepID=UPI0011428872|nr:EamA/RhaT family transporter [Ramlibacter sp. WS9]ROZ74409.1 EamA/RhaT family transporter [Ramlibacter sp. WS9]